MQDKLFAQPGSTGFNFSSERGVKVFLLTLNRELSPANTSATFNTHHAPHPLTMRLLEVQNSIA